MTDKGLGWIAVKQDRLKAVLVPHRLGASVIEGWGEVRSAYADMEFAAQAKKSAGKSWPRGRSTPLWRITSSPSLPTSGVEAARASDP